MRLPILLLVLSIPSVPSSTPSIQDVSWISGCWETTRNGRHITEHWMPPEGGTMIGMSRTVAAGKTSAWEFLIIRQGTAGLDYVARPSGQPEATFTATTATATEVAFENPAHDFPTRIVYTRKGDALTAVTEGPSNGQTRRIEFAYTRAQCAG